MGGIISGILGGGSSPGQEAQMAGIQQSREGINRYRPELMQAYTNLLSNASAAYQPMNNALETMYGGRPNPKMDKGSFNAGGNLGPGRGMGRFMGHDLPSQPVPGSAGGTGRDSGKAADDIYSLLDPTNVFGGR